MDTIKKQKSQTEQRKGGLNDFSKLLVSGGGLVISSIGGVILGRTILKPAPDTQKEDDTSKEAADEAIAENAQSEQNVEEKQTSPESSEVQEPAEEPTPIDTNNGSNGSNGETPTPPENNTQDDGVDEIAQRIANSTEIDGNDDATASVMQIGSSSVMYDENGNTVNVFAVEFNDPGLAGQQFVLVDIDGDGIYDSLYTADGQPFSLTFANVDGSVTSFEDILANANLEYADLEEMGNSDGSYMARNDLDEDASIENALQDIFNNDDELDTQALLAQLQSEGSEDVALYEGTGEAFDGEDASIDEDGDTTEINDGEEYDEA